MIYSTWRLIYSDIFRYIQGTSLVCCGWWFRDSDTKNCTLARRCGPPARPSQKWHRSPRGRGRAEVNWDRLIGGQNSPEIGYIGIPTHQNAKHLKLGTWTIGAIFYSRLVQGIYVYQLCLWLSDVLALSVGHDFLKDPMGFHELDSTHSVLTLGWRELRTRSCRWPQRAALGTHQ